MKTYNVTNRVSAQAKAELNRIIGTHEKFRHSYFFHPSCNASGRRSNEKRFEENNPDVSFIKGGDTIEVSMRYSESCNNVYYKLYVIVNGANKNISVIKKLLKK